MLPSAPPRSVPALRRQDHGSLQVRARAAPPPGAAGGRESRTRREIPGHANPIPAAPGSAGRRRPAVLTHRAGHAWGAGSAGALAAVPHPHRAALIHEDVEEMAGAQRSGERAAGILCFAAPAGCGGDCRPWLAAPAPRAPAPRSPRSRSPPAAAPALAPAPPASAAPAAHAHRTPD